MTQHFVTSSAAQPEYFTFSQNFNNADDQGFELILKDFEDQFDTLQQRSWLKYWTRQGQHIILEEWQLKYEDYLVQATEADKVTGEPVEENSVQDCDSIGEGETISNEIDDQSENDTESWQQLWQQHSEEVYFEKYILYNSIYYNYYLDLKKSLQAKVEYCSEEAEAGETFTESADDIAAELEQLRLLGLPTAFGCRPQRTRKRRSNATSTGNTVAHFSDFFSDEEEETLLTVMDLSNAALHKVQNKAISKKKKNRHLRNVPQFMLEDKSLLKYWRMRFSLFSRFDEGIRLDRESWFSVTPEKIAVHLAERLACDILVDGFCGSGGNAIQFAKTCRKVIAIDIDPAKLEMAKHNAGIYGVADKIEFIVGDFLQLSSCGKLRGDIVFLSPPWGGPTYKNKQDYDIERFLLPVGATELMTQSLKISENVAVFLPRNSNMQQVIKLAGVGNRCEVEHNYLDTRLVGITALYGEEILSVNQ